jgi:hypothetical protein
MILQQARGLLQDMDTSSSEATRETNATRPPPLQYRIRLLLDNLDD